MITKRVPIKILRYLSLLFISSCAGATSHDLAQSPADGQWRFKTDLRTTSECLAAALNHEYQPKTGFQQLMSRSINHQIVVIEPGKTNQVIHEHIGPATMWLFTITAEGQGSTAEAHVLKSRASKTVEVLERSALSCSGTPL